MDQDQRHARIFGVLFIITFITSIGRRALPARSRRSSRLHRWWREGQPDLPGSLPGVPSHHRERRNGRRPLPDRAASERGSRHRLRRRSNHRVRLHCGRDHLHARSRQPAARSLLAGTTSPSRSRRSRTGRSCSAPGYTVPLGNGLILGYLMYKSGLVPRRMAWLGMIGGPLLLFRALGTLFDWWDQTARSRASWSSRSSSGRRSSASTAPSGGSGGRHRFSLETAHLPSSSGSGRPVSRGVGRPA